MATHGSAAMRFISAQSHEGSAQAAGARIGLRPPGPRGIGYAQMSIVYALLGEPYPWTVPLLHSAPARRTFPQIVRHVRSAGQAIIISLAGDTSSSHRAD